MIFLLTAGCSKTQYPKKLIVQKYTRTQDLKIETMDSIFINGTLEYANNNQLVIFIAGSGPTDRDCNNAGGLKTDAFKMLASHLYDQGVSTFRYDKRGIGASTKVSEATMTIDEFIYDVQKIIEHFENDFNKIILLGHSEGSLIGSVASQNEKVHSLISVSGPGKRFDEVLLDQLAKYPKLVPLAEKHINEINNGKELSEVNPMLKALFRPSVTPFLKSVFSLSPSDEIGKLNKPILVISGSCDLQVPEEEARILHAANKNSELIVIPNMGHAMKELELDCSNASAAYADAAMPLNGTFKSAVYNFISKQ